MGRGHRPGESGRRDVPDIILIHLLQNAGSLEVTDPEMIVPEDLSGYIPVAGSPLVNNGLDLKKLFETEPGSHDILGTPVSADGNYDIGAVERIGL